MSGEKQIKQKQLVFLEPGIIEGETKEEAVERLIEVMESQGFTITGKKQKLQTTMLNDNGGGQRMGFEISGVVKNRDENFSFSDPRKAAKCVMEMLFTYIHQVLVSEVLCWNTALVENRQNNGGICTKIKGLFWGLFLFRASKEKKEYFKSMSR